MKHLLDILNVMKDLLAEIRGLRSEMKLWKKADTEHHLTDNGTLAETTKAFNATIEKINAYFEKAGIKAEG